MMHQFTRPMPEAKGQHRIAIQLTEEVGKPQSGAMNSAFFFKYTLVFSVEGRSQGKG
jgi:hypothetical protein